MLRGIVVAGVQNPPRNPDIVPGVRKFHHEFVEKRAMPADREPLHILEDESPRAEFRDEANEFAHQPVARVVEYAMADQGKALARGAAEHAIDRPIANTRGLDDRGSR